MQGNDNLIRTFKQKDKLVKRDAKRDKTRDKSVWKKERKLKEKESDDV